MIVKRSLAASLTALAPLLLCGCSGLTAVYARNHTSENVTFKVTVDDDLRNPRITTRILTVSPHSKLSAEVVSSFGQIPEIDVEVQSAGPLRGRVFQFPRLATSSKGENYFLDITDRNRIEQSQFLRVAIQSNGPAVRDALLRNAAGRVG
jgi:hypothetical protein